MFNLIIIYLSFIFSIIKIGLLGFITQALMSYILIISKYTVKPNWRSFIYDLKFFLIKKIIWILVIIIAAAFSNVVIKFFFLEFMWTLVGFIVYAGKTYILQKSKYTVKPIWRSYTKDLRFFLTKKILALYFFFFKKKKKGDKRNRTSFNEMSAFLGYLDGEYRIFMFDYLDKNKEDLKLDIYKSLTRSFTRFIRIHYNISKNLFYTTSNIRSNKRINSRIIQDNNS